MNSQAWWRDAAIYQVYPRSFRDSNGDGEGDLQGVIARIPYLADLGIDAIWLSPFYKSPNRDGGYDVADPRDVDPRFGTLADAKQLIEAAHERGIRFIADIVPNHFSSDHIWFQEALNSPKGSAARSRFHFYDGRGENGEVPPNNWISIFRGPAWTRTPDGQWYLHLFDSSQPDLNWNNPDVATDFEKTLRFWLDLGVDGFRSRTRIGWPRTRGVDGNVLIAYSLESTGSLSKANTPKTHSCKVVRRATITPGYRRESWLDSQQKMILGMLLTSLLVVAVCCSSLGQEFPPILVCRRTVGLAASTTPNIPRRASRLKKSFRVKCSAADLS